MRVGTGYDIHRLKEGTGFMLGGVWIPAEHGVLSHSDGDVLIHASLDALLGAMGLGDLGDWFPPSDPKWKGASGSSLVEPILKAADERGFRIENIDTTVFLERPMIGHLKPSLCESMTRLFRCSHVSVKAGTFEGLAPIGSGQAVAAQAIVLLGGP